MLDGELGSLDERRLGVQLRGGDQLLEAVVLRHRIGIEEQEVLAPRAGQLSQRIVGSTKANVAGGGRVVARAQGEVPHPAGRFRTSPWSVVPEGDGEPSFNGGQLA